jgi:hypothetical protein
VIASTLGGVAQESSSAGIVGTVLDASGAVVPGATVHVTNVGTNATRTTTTNGQGEFSVPNLRPAQYQIRVEMSGFRTTTVPPFDLRIGEVARRSVSLEVGTEAQTVEVSAQAPLLQTDTAAVGQVVNQRQIEQLPLNGRNLVQLATLSAGVAPKDPLRGTQYGGRDEYVQVDGGRDSSTNYVIDGVYVRSLRFNNLSIRPSVDTIQEFSVLRNSFSTEYGQGQSVVTAVTKSGTNQIHGSGYEFLRNDALDAKNYFDKPGSKAALHRNQFGGTLGGPIVKDKVFFFGGYEGLRNTQGQIFSGVVPSTTDLPRDLSQGAVVPGAVDPQTGVPFPGGLIPANRISNYAKVLAPTIPVANTAGKTNFFTTQSYKDDYDEVTARSDQSLSDKHSMFERYIWFNSSLIQPAAFTSTNYPQYGQNLSVGDTYLLRPNIVNEVRLGYNRAIAFIQPLSLGGKNWSQELGLHNIAGLTDPIDLGRPNTTIGSFSVFGDGGIVQGAQENIYSAADTISYVTHGHTMRVGVQFQHRRFNQVTEVTAKGAFTFNGASTVTGGTRSAVGDFLLGVCAICNGDLGSTHGHYRDNTYALFFNDVWNTTRKLTLNLGIRWEYASPWVEQDHLEADFDPASGLIGFNKVPSNLPAALLSIFNTNPNVFPAGIVKPDKNNFGPRIGLAYRLTDSTVIRSGFGVYFDNTNLNELQFTRLIAPFTLRFSTRNKDVSTLFPDLNVVQKGDIPAPFAIDPTNRSPYTLQWNLSVQRSFGGSFVTELAYTGSETHKLWKRYNQNQALPPDPANPFFFGSNLSQQVFPFSTFGNGGILTSKNWANANFHGLSAKLEKRFSRGVSVLSSFQWSHNLDDGSGEIEANDTAFAQHPEFDYGNARFDRRYRFTTAFGYELPFGNGKPWLHDQGLVTAVLGNWQVQGIFTALSADWLTPSANASENCNCGQFVPQRVNLASGRADKGKIGDPTPTLWFDPTAFAKPGLGFQGNAGRNVLQGPAFNEFDFSAIKNFKLTESAGIQFRGEFFNLLNHPNFGDPQTNIQSAAAGQITTANDGRDIQVGLRITW